MSNPTSTGITKNKNSQTLGFDQKIEEGNKQQIAEANNKKLMDGICHNGGISDMDQPFRRFYHIDRWLLS